MKQGLNRETTSEYQRSFDDRKFHSFPQNYQTNLDFRVQQKGRFQRHVRAPFEWDEDEWYETESDVSCDELFQSRRRVQPLSKYKHNKLNRMYVDRVSHGYDAYATRPRTASSSPGKQHHGNGRHDAVLGSDGEGGRGGRRDIYIHYDDDDDDNDYGDDEGVGKSRSTSDVAKRERRHRSASRSRQWTDPGAFVPYGKSNNATEISQKKTHNVKASDQVHQSALRAQDRLRAQQIENSESRRRLHDNTRAEASRNSAIHVSTYTPKGVRGAPYGTAADGKNREKSGYNKDGIYRHGITTDKEGKVVPWQRGGSRSPYIPDGSGTKRWISEYEREFQAHQPPPRGTMSIPGAGIPQDPDWAKRTVGASYPPNDPVGFGLSYGRRLRDQDIIPAI